MKYKIPLPAIKSCLSNIRLRCDDKRSSYGARGIKCLLSLDDLVSTYKRDKAWTLTQPSIDRINGAGHYELNNIQWIERIHNSCKPTAPRESWVKYNAYHRAIRISNELMSKIKKLAKQKNRSFIATLEILVENSIKEGLIDPK